MKLTRIRDLYKNREAYMDQKVTVGGWVRSIRDSKSFGFIVVNDGTFFEPLQVVYHDTMENFEEISRLNVGAAIIVTGTLVATPQAKQPFEIQADTVEVEGASAPEYPLQKKRHSFEYLRTIAHLRPRTNTFQAVFRVRSLTAYAIHKFFQERDFVYVHTPIITGSDCEGAGEMFRVTTLDLENVPKDKEGHVDYSQDFFGKETSLTVSGQLNGETYAQAFRNIYTFGPTFRAENSNTTRHAAEFWMIEPEIAFADLEDNMDLAESMLKYVINYVLEAAPEEMNFFNSFVDKGLLERLHNVVSSEFARVTYTEAIELLEKNNDQAPGVCNRLSQGDQGLLHEGKPGRQDRGGGRLSGSGDRRDHRRKPEGGRLRQAESPDRGAGDERGRLPVLHGPAQIWFHPARRIRSWIRARCPVRDRCSEYKGCDSLSKVFEELRVLSSDSMKAYTESCEDETSPVFERIVLFSLLTFLRE